MKTSFLLIKNTNKDTIKKEGDKMLLSQIDENKLNKEKIDKILFDIPKDDGLKGDCIWVFGTSNYLDERLELAAKLYKEGRAPFILLSGGFGKKGTVREAEIMKEKLLSLGIKEEVILTEKESNNTTENVLCALLVLERKFLLQNIKRLIVVTSIYHIQRLQLTLSRYMPKWIEYSFCYKEDSEMSKDNWMKKEETIEKINKEAKGIIFYAKNKYIDDKEINI